MQFLWRNIRARHRKDVCPERRKDPVFLLNEMREEYAQAKEESKKPQMDKGIP